MGFLKLCTYIFSYIIIVSYFMSGLIVNCIQFLLYLGVKPYSKYYYRKINYYLIYSINCHMFALSDWYCKTDLYVNINLTEYQKYFGREHAFIIMNHRYETDWLLLGCISETVGCAGNLKPFTKKSVQYVPVFGWLLYFAESVFLHRNFEKDKSVIQKQITELINYPDPVWLLLCPEGTRFTPEKHEVSLKYTKKGLPQLKYHLTPRTKGFITSLAHMGNKMRAIYDVTVACETKRTSESTISNILLGKKSEAHFYIKRIPFEEIPQDEEKIKQFMNDMFYRKDKLLDSFFKTNDFFTTSGIERVDNFKIRPRYSSLLNLIFWHAVINIPIAYYMLKLLLSGNIYTLMIILGIIFACVFYLNKVVENGVLKSSYGTELKKKP